MDALNASKCMEEIAYQSMSELLKLGMNEKKTLECQNCILYYSHVPQEMWPSVNEHGMQNYHQTQILSDVDVFEGFAMDYHIALFFQLDDMLVPKEETLNKITQRLEDVHILLGDDISNPVAIMCTHGGKQWSGHAKVHLKNVQEDGVKLLQGLRPFIIRLDNKMHKEKICKSYDTIKDIIN